MERYDDEVEIFVRWNGDETCGNLAGVGKPHPSVRLADQPAGNGVGGLNDRRVRCVAKWLAQQFLERRRLSGEEVTAIVSQAWEQFDLAFREGVRA